MDVDASERRPGGGGRGSHEEPVMEETSELYVIREPETAERRKVLQLSGIRSHGPAEARPLGRPWPRQVSWRDSLRRYQGPMEQKQKQHGMQQQQYQGADRRLSQTMYQGGYERRKPDPLFDEATAPPAAANPGMSTQERKDEQAERTRQQQEKDDEGV